MNTMKRLILAVLAAVVPACLPAYSQNGKDSWLWPVKGGEAGAGILCKPQQYLGKELNFDGLFIGAPLGAEVVCPADGQLVFFSVGALTSLTTSVSGGHDFEDFDTGRRAFIASGEIPVPDDYVNGSVSIRLQDGRKIHIEGLRGTVKLKTGMTLHKGDLLGTVAYAYKGIPEPHIEVSVSTPQDKADDPMAPFGLETTFQAPGEVVLPDRLTAEQAREDLALLLDSYRQLYPSLNDVVTPEKLATFDSAAKVSFAQGISYSDFHRLVLKSTALVHDSHLQVLTDNAAYTRESQYCPHLFPGVVDSVLTVRGVESGWSDYLGKEIASLDGVPAEKLIEKVRQDYVKNYDLDNRSIVADRLMRAWNYFYDNDCFRPRTVKIAFRDGSTLDDSWVPLKRFGKMIPGYSRAYIQRMTEHYNNPYRFRMLDDSTAWLALNTFQLFDTQLDAIEDSLRAHQDAANLIFDVRDNPGGADEAVTRMAGWFLDGPSVPLKAYSKVLSNTTYPILAHSNNYSADFEIFKEYVPVAGKDGFYAGYDSVRVLQPDPAFRFGGKLYFLTSETSVSAASLLPSILVRNHRAVTVGRETGTAYHFMTAMKFADMILPNSRIQVRVPLMQTWFDETVTERTPFGRGLLPDYEVPLSPDEYSAEIPDPVLARALELIAAGQYLGENPFAEADAASSASSLGKHPGRTLILCLVCACFLLGLLFGLRPRHPKKS